MPKFLINKSRSRNNFVINEKHELFTVSIDNLTVWVERVPEANLSDGRDSADYTFLNGYLCSELSRDAKSLAAAISTLVKAKIAIVVKKSHEFDMERNIITGADVKVLISTRNFNKAMILAEDIRKYVDRYLTELSKQIFAKEDRSITWVSMEDVLKVVTPNTSSAETSSPRPLGAAIKKGF